MLDLVPESLGSLAATRHQQVPATGRCRWMLGVPLAGTVNGVAAVAETTSANAIYVADVGTPGLKVVHVPHGANFIELGAFGDGNAITTQPVIELWRSHGPPLKAGFPAQPDYWSKLYNQLGANSVTLGGTITDTTGTASPTYGPQAANRYSIEEGTYLQNVFDLRGASLVVARVTTIGTANNWSLAFRFF